ncbi:unnamed protein product [Rotaria sp. Silwood2]|nr:unnamed protein product [Rotaria sp. Silwood2]CAF4658011.1 unnamed protein product [Rotaria sp. Silwood2]
MELEFIISSKYWIIKPCFSKTAYDENLMSAWNNTMKDILKLNHTHHPILIIAPNPLITLEDVLSNAEIIKYDNNVKYSISILHPENEHDKELLKIAVDSVEFECAALWFVVINESNHFISLSDINVQLLACVADGTELLWLNPGSKISINEILNLLKSYEWKVSIKHNNKQIFI